MKKSKWIKGMSLGFATLMIGGTFVGCSSSQGGTGTIQVAEQNNSVAEGSTQATPTSAPIKLVFWHSMGGAGGEEIGRAHV